MLRAHGAWAAGATAMLCCSAPAVAADCPAGYVCAADPQSVISSLQAQGYKALLTKDDKPDSDGGPSYIESSASGYTFQIYFKDCTKGADCQSLEFVASFTKDPSNSLAMANDWNLTKRFATMYLKSDGGIGTSYDVTTTGGLDQVNFADAVDWWANGVLGHLKAFFDAHPAGKDGTPWAPAPPAAAAK